MVRRNVARLSPVECLQAHLALQLQKLLTVQYAVSVAASSFSTMHVSADLHGVHMYSTVQIIKKRITTLAHAVHLPSTLEASSLHRIKISPVPGPRDAANELFRSLSRMYCIRRINFRSGI